jgi:hypothetical protein
MYRMYRLYLLLMLAVAGLVEMAAEEGPGAITSATCAVGSAKRRRRESEIGVSHSEGPKVLASFSKARLILPCDGRVARILLAPQRT